MRPFSRGWLGDAIKDGRLRKMAGLSDGVSDSGDAGPEEGAELDMSYFMAGSAKRPCATEVQ